MTCDKCEHFEIMYEPQRINGVVLDMGRAHCKKYNLIVDFVNHVKLKRLECPDMEVLIANMDVNAITIHCMKHMK